MSLSRMQWLLVIGAVIVQAIYISIAPFIVTLDTHTMLGNIVNGSWIGRLRGPLFSFPLFARATGIGWNESLIGMIAAHSVLSVAIVWGITQLALPAGRAVLLLTGALLFASLTPFVLSMWFMNDHLYMGLLVLSAVLYQSLIGKGSMSRAMMLAVCLFIAAQTRPNGAMLPVVVAFAFAWLFFTQRDTITQRLKPIAATALCYALLTIGHGLIAPQAQDGQSSNASGRWLFCQIYSRGTTPDETRFTLNETPAGQEIARKIRRQYEDPELLNIYTKRWPERFAHYKGNSAQLVEDLINNNPPDDIKPFIEHKFCWGVYEALDAITGTQRTNVLLMQAWREVILTRPDLWAFYAKQFWNFFFNIPNESSNRLVTDDIGTSLMPAGVYAQSYGVGRHTEQHPFIVGLYKYALSFYYRITPILSFFALFSLPALVSRRKIAPALLFAWGMLSYQALAVAISNVITMRYYVVVYPFLVFLAAYGFMSALQWLGRIRLHIGYRLNRPQ